MGITMFLSMRFSGNLGGAHGMPKKHGAFLVSDCSEHWPGLWGETLDFHIAAAV